MKKISTCILAIIAITLNIHLAKAESQSIDSCVSAVQKQKISDFIKLEKLSAAGKSFYEIEIKDEKGAEWEFMCNSTDGKIFEQESEVTSADSEAFKKHLKISEAEAIAIALKVYPGKVQEVEYEIEANGDASYELDIVNDKKIETKVEVDAKNGKIIEVATEEWEIGEESNAKR
jgi:uncharacterized membrane protein YkoI